MPSAPVVKPEPPTDGGTDDIDFDVLPGLIGYHLRRAQVAVFAHFADSIARQATPGQFGVLTLIGVNPGLTQSALASAVGIERSTAALTPSSSVTPAKSCSTNSRSGSAPTTTRQRRYWMRTRRRP